MKKHIGYIGLGKMGGSMVERLKEQDWRVETYDISGSGTAQSVEELVDALEKPRVVWIMVPAFAKATAGKPSVSPIDDVVEQLTEHLDSGDIAIDGGNSFYEKSVERGKKLAAKGIHFLDVGVSGGPGTVRDGKPAIMIGGEKKVFSQTEGLFADLTRKESVGYMGRSGAGHFVKMVHNGIEYGMMQSLAEGFTLMKEAPFGLDLKEVARIYSNGSVIESRLTKWVESGFKEYGEDLKEVAGSIQHTGEGEWTVRAAEKLGVPLPAIRAALEFRVESEKKPSYTGKIVMMLRNQFGGHSIN